MWAHSSLDLEPGRHLVFLLSTDSPCCAEPLWMGSFQVMTSSGGPAEAAQRERRLLPPAPHLKEQSLTPTSWPASGAKFTSCLLRCEPAPAARV